MFPSIIFFIIFVYVLFVALTPGVLLTLPPNSPHIIVALVHGLIFIIVGVLTTILIAKFSNRREGKMEDGGNHGIPSPSQQIINNNINKQYYEKNKISNEKDKISNEAMIKQLNESIDIWMDMKKKEMSNTTSVVKGSGLKDMDYDFMIQQAEEEKRYIYKKIKINDSIINQPLYPVVY